MFFSILLLILVLLSFFAIKAKTFDRLGEWSQMTIVAIASLMAAAILTMQFFIAVRRTWEAFVSAIRGIPMPLIGFIFLLLLLLTFPLLRLLGRLDLARLKSYWHEEVAPRQRDFIRSALDLARSLAWDRTKSLFRRVASFRGRREPPGGPVPPEQPEGREY